MRADKEQMGTLPIMAVGTLHGWADVIGIVRDLLGERWIVWQLRTGQCGVVKGSEATVRLS